ncbi:MAG: helix-turn-helix domain-containing protein [Candidatus Tectimicrobiota bacterium]
MFECSSQVSARWRGHLSAMLCGGLLFLSPSMTVAQRLPAPHESSVVLTLDEAARLLRLRPEEIARLAARGQMPGRRIGGRWRFSRAALLDWLAGTETVSSPNAVAPAPAPTPAPSLERPLPVAEAFARPERESSPPQPGRPLAEAQTPLVAERLAHTTGRGTAAAPERQPAAAQVESESIGKKPTQATAEDAALRSQRVLLAAKQLTLEFGLFYTKSEDESLILLPSGVGFVPALAAGEQDTFTSTLTARYGLVPDLQLLVSGALQHQTVMTTVLNDERRDTDLRSGDVILALRYAALKEGKGYPDIIFSLEGRLPTEASAYSLGGGLTLVKSLDPVALFADLRYRYTFTDDAADPTHLQPASIYSSTLGYAFAFNDVLSFSMAVTGLFTTRTTFRAGVLPARERLSLQLGLTSVLREGLYVEPTVSFALNGPANVTLGVSLPLTFDLW